MNIVKARPMHLNLFVMKFPITAISSICHRISGIWIFICLPFLLLMLQESLASLESFSNISNKFNNIYYKLFFLSFLAASVYHAIAGMRHIIMDLGFFESKNEGKITSWIVIISSAIIFLFLGFYLW
jgi:succinate dehydrogenase / fumarate reductase cytochrome b subunit